MYCYVVKWPVFLLQRESVKSPVAPSNFSPLWFSRWKHFIGFFLYSLSIYHFTLSSPDTLLLFLDYKPKSGDSLDTSTDNFTAKEVQITYRLFLVIYYLLDVPRLPSPPASNAVGWVIDFV